MQIITRRGLLLVGAGAAATWRSAAAAREVPRIGFIGPSSGDTKRNLLDAFRGGLKELGWTETDDVIILDRWPDERTGPLPQIAAELMGASAGDLVEAGLVESLNRPGRNVTGISSLALELEGKRLEFLKELLPTISRIAVLRDAANPYSVMAIKQQRMAAQELGVELVEVQVQEAADIDQAFSTILDRQLKALCIHAYVPVLAGRDRIVTRAAKDGVAVVYPLRDYVDAGGLMSYGANLNDNAKRAAVQVSKILSGAKPADLPVERSTKVEMVINLKTAKALGLTMPQSLLARADEVID